LKNYLEKKMALDPALSGDHDGELCDIAWCQVVIIIIININIAASFPYQCGSGCDEAQPRGPLLL
jgi:hypothetical protein